MQTRLQSLIEVLHNQWIGIVTGWLIVYFIFPLFNHLPQFWVANISTVLFFVSSSLRAYILRRYFNKMC